ncbi:MAG: hypothetical protein HC838_14060 [Spirulinaceae cyanobacterium RM2_2_10]|nr:hypothetical protein [Spirulinaceae cyanobacterium SM2_1_0]NJO20932.1 hypothetical protein [Spirulinaceae cyanobacterium RM2_2_10]
MARRKKQFPCGHKGYGQQCHRCAQQEAVRAQEQAERHDWQASFERDPIDLRALPKHVVRKTRDIIQALAEQQDYRQFGGKRLRHDRTVVSIPVTRSYRLLCRYEGGILVPEAAMSHEDYNVAKPGG